MHRLTRRRGLAAGIVVFAAGTGAVVARPMEIEGTVGFAGDAPLPAGWIEVSLEDTAIEDRARRRIAQAGVESGGGMRTIGFSLDASTTTSATLRVVARLERLDGWLLARGSAAFEADSPVHVTLREVMY